MRCFAMALAVALLSASNAVAQRNSADPASQLCALMKQDQLKAVAAVDPASPDTFVAASYVDNLGLLFVSAKSSAGAYLKYAIEQHKYDDAYTTLNGTAVPQGKLFIQDAGGDGLRQERAQKDDVFDIAYVDVTTQLALNGDWKPQHLTEEQYKARYKEIDQRYARGLALLLAQLKPTSQTVPLLK